MAWYYYSGNVSRAVPVKPGLTKSVKPHSKVEIVTIDHQAKALIRKGLLVRTSKPRGEALIAEAKEVSKLKIEDVVKVEDWAKSISEKGTTTSSQDALRKLAKEVKTQVELADMAGDAVINEPTETVSEEEDVEGSEEQVATDDNNGKIRKRRQK